MLPRLSADESMRAANQIAFGTGNMEQDAARQMSARWSREAHPNQTRAKATPQQLGTIGIKVRTAPPRHG